MICDKFQTILFLSAPFTTTKFTRIITYYKYKIIVDSMNSNQLKKFDNVLKK